MNIPPMQPRDDRPDGERCEVTLRDTFAAAALTGLLCNGDYSMESIPRHALSMADAMLKERAKTNHDASPDARAACEDCQPQAAAESENPVRASNAGCTGKQPAPPCVESDGFSSGSRPGPINRTPERESPRRECGESSLRDVPQPDNGRAAGGPEPLFTSVLPVSYAKTNAERVDYATKRDTTQPRIGALDEPPRQVFVQKNLTDEEREAVKFFAVIDSNDSLLGGHAATLRKLLERMK